jgi:hypothetical protein
MTFQEGDAPKKISEDGPFHDNMDGDPLLTRLIIINFGC